MSKGEDLAIIHSILNSKDLLKSLAPEGADEETVSRVVASFIKALENMSEDNFSLEKLEDAVLDILSGELDFPTDIKSFREEYYAIKEERIEPIKDFTAKTEGSAFGRD